MASRVTRSAASLVKPACATSAAVLAASLTSFIACAGSTKVTTASRIEPSEHAEAAHRVGVAGRPGREHDHDGQHDRRQRQPDRQHPVLQGVGYGGHDHLEPVEDSAVGHVFQRGDPAGDRRHPGHHEVGGRSGGDRAGIADEVVAAAEVVVGEPPRPAVHVADRHARVLERVRCGVRDGHSGRACPSPARTPGSPAAPAPAPSGTGRPGRRRGPGRRRWPSPRSRSARRARRGSTAGASWS